MERSQDYNCIARHFSDYVAEAVTEWTLGYPKVIEFLEPLDGKNILDYGCGAGDFAGVLAGLGAHVTGVDISEEMIRLASSRKISANFLLRSPEGVADALKESFDAATLNFVLCTIFSPDRIISVLSEIHHLLKPGAVCVAMHTNWERCNGAEFASFKLSRVAQLESGKPVVLWLKGDSPLRIEDCFWSLEDYCRFYRQAGFSMIAITELAAQGEAHPTWIDEQKTPPFYLVSGYKTGGTRT